MSVALLQAESTSVLHSAPSISIRAGISVRCRDGSIGRVGRLAPSWAEHPTHLVVHTGPLVRQEIVIPLRWVERVTDKEVVLHVRRRHVARVRPCVTEALLETEVREALYNTPQFRNDDAFLHIDVVVREHVVTLRGNVRTQWRSLLAETVARQAPGVWDVQNELVGDDELEDAVLQALRRDSRLNRSILSVQSMLGQVTLRGQVRTAEAAALAVLLARRVAGVRTVSNELVVSKITTREPAPLIEGHALFAARRTQQSCAG